MFATMPRPRGAIPTERHKLAAAKPHVITDIAPAQFIRIPPKLSYWLNNVKGDCVLAEEAFKCAAHYTEIFITDADVESWGASRGLLNGAGILDVIERMQRYGFSQNGYIYGDGAPTAVDWTNGPLLQNAIWKGPVKIGVAAGQLENVVPGPPRNGWFATSFKPDSNEDHCFTGDTKVSLLDGRELSFVDLANGAAGSLFWVYSCDNDGNIVCGKAHSVRKTRENAEIVKVTLDNGESVRCTTDHRFLMRDGTYKEARNLKAEDSLMPLYRRLSKGGYELIYMPRLEGKSAWHPTHRMAAFGPSCRSHGMHAHHINLNKRNNSPENLRVMTPKDHTALHEHLSNYNRTAEHRATARRLMRQLWDDPVWAEKQRAKLAASASARGKKTGELGKSGFQTMSIEIRRQNGAAARGRVKTAEAKRKYAESMRKRCAEDREFREQLRLLALNASYAAALKPITEKQREARRENARRLNERFQERRQLACANNHKVVSVEACGREDVYDLTVDEYHNFALSAGVFVHNCVSLAGYGSIAWLASQFGVEVPAGVDGAAPGYEMFTWSSLGIIDEPSLLAICGEAWLRHPNTTIKAA